MSSFTFNSIYIPSLDSFLNSSIMLVSFSISSLL
nr:MAG TPA: hypothetical protein [Caudoviricetes sp.]